MRRLAALLLFAAGAAQAQTSGPTFGAPYRFTEAGGAAIYAAVCAGCHMPDGRGAAGAGAYPSLAGDPRLASAGYPIALVLRGHGAMPALGRLLTDEQIADVVNYVRTNFGNAYPGDASVAEVAATR